MPSQPRRSYQGDCCPGETLAVYKNRIKKEHDYNGIRNKTDAHPKSTQTPQNIELVISTRRSNTCYISTVLWQANLLYLKTHVVDEPKAVDLLHQPQRKVKRLGKHWNLLRKLRRGKETKNTKSSIISQTHLFCLNN